MSDPLGIIGGINRIDPALPASRPPRPGEGIGSDFRQELKRQLSEVNRLQQDASLATQEVLTGQRDDVEAVMLAAQKADSAFRMLLAVRNKMVDAYDELKQMRV
jgi:flagellar hook-basal body complex protein FliE